MMKSYVVLGRPSICWTTTAREGRARVEASRNGSKIFLPILKEMVSHKLTVDLYRRRMGGKNFGDHRWIDISRGNVGPQ